MHTVLIANRGEIAARLILACHEAGLRAVAVYVGGDVEAPHVTLADAAYEVGSYLDGAGLLAVAREAGADALHPGYGFLSEDAGFAAAVVAAGLVWVGPRAEAIATMGHKWRARELARAAGVPVLAGGLGLPDAYPVMLKAAEGGGGLGLRRVERAEDHEAAAHEARVQCAAAFSSRRHVTAEDIELYWEAFAPAARHVEVQVVADRHGGVAALGVRECSVQRRFQKVIEECPAPGVDAALLGELAVRVAAAVGYDSVGTVEFLWTAQGPVFLEMNTRLQVEHPVTELVYGLDLPVLQLAVAAGGRLPALPEPRGHAIEARVYAEDPVTGAPAPGRIDHLLWPGGPWIRVDAGVRPGQEVSPAFDPLIAKVCAWGPTRELAVRRLAAALARTEIAGTLATNLPQLRALLEAPELLAGAMDTAFLASWAFAPGHEGHGLAAQLAGLQELPVASAASAHNWARRPWRA